MRGGSPEASPRCAGPARRRGAEGFNARFSAIWRRYAYRVTDNPGGVDPLLRGQMSVARLGLDVDAHERGLRRAARRARLRGVLQEARGRDHHPYAPAAGLGAGEDGIITATVRADAFCHNMVRSLVGALLPVGEGRRPVEWPGEVLARAVRDSAVHVVRPHGLTLEEVGYPGAEELARRAAETRRVRTLSS